MFLVQPISFQTHYQEPITKIRTYTQPQRSKQTQIPMKNSQVNINVNNNIQPKIIQEKMEEQEKYYEITAKNLLCGGKNIDDDNDNNNNHNWDSNDDESIFSSESIEKRRKKELTHCIFLQNVAAIPNEPKIIENIKKIISSASVNNNKKIKKIRKEQKIGSKLFKSLFFESIFTVENLLKEIKIFAPILRSIYHSRQSKRYLLGNIEKIVIENHEKLLLLLNDILFGFYEYEILSEDDLFEWFNIPTSSFVSLEQLETLQIHCTLFLTWLYQDENDD